MSHSSFYLPWPFLCSRRESSQMQSNVTPLSYCVIEGLFFAGHCKFPVYNTLLHTYNTNCFHKINYRPPVLKIFKQGLWYYVALKGLHRWGILHELFLFIYSPISINRKVGKEKPNCIFIKVHTTELHIFTKKSAFSHYVCDLEESQGDGIAYD